METEKTTEQMEEENLEQELNAVVVVNKEEGALTTIEQADALVVQDTTSASRSVSLEKNLKEQDKAFRAVFKTKKQEIDARKKKMLDKEKEHCDPYTEQIASLQTKRATYNEQERQRLAKEAEERASKEAAERAQRVQVAQTELDGLLATTEDSQVTVDLLYMMLDEDNPSEEQAQVWRAKIKSIEATIAGASREAAEAAAKAEMEASAPPPPPPMAPPKVAGEVTGWAYKVEVVDMKALCKAIGEGTVAIAAVKPAEGKLNSYAKDGIIKHGEFGCNVTKKPTSHTRP